MATFEYNALTSAGRLMKGSIESGSSQEASELLKQMGLDVNSIEQAKEKKPKTSVGRNEFLLFNQQLASITKAGIPLEKGLRELSKDIRSRSMRKLVDAIADELESGVSIEDAFAKRQKAFPPLYGKILKAGVETGRLSEMLTTLNSHLETTNQTRKIILEAISYPAIILTFAAIISSFIIMFIIPQFREILSEMFTGRMPLITSSVLHLPELVIPFWITIGILVAATIILFMFLSSFVAGRRFKENLLLNIPVLGRVYHSSILSKMSEAMAMMVAAGSDMPATLRLSSSASGSENIVLESEMVASHLEKGAPILEAGQYCKVIPRLFLYSIQLGTQRNELEDSLYNLAQMYDSQTRSWQSALQSVLLPLMIIFVGGFIAFVILGIFLPIVQIVNSLSAM